MPEPRTHVLAIASPPDDINAVHALLETVWSEASAISVEDRMRFETALIELTSNVLRHAHDGSGLECTLTVTVMDDRIDATLSDTGRAGMMELTSRAMPGELAEVGRGIPLIRALVDELHYQRDGDINRWRITRRLGAGDSEPGGTGASAPGAVMSDEPIEVATSAISIAGVIDEISRRRSLEHAEAEQAEHEDRFDRVTRLARQLFGVDAAVVSLVDHESHWYRSRSGSDIPESPGNAEFCSATIADSDPFTLTDAAADPRFRDNPLVTGEPHIRFWAGIPLLAVSGERIGALCIFDSRPREFGAAEVALLRDLAGWVEYELTVEHEIERASEVQQSLLPKLVLSLPGFDVAGACVAARAVGGDFYDWYPVGEGAVFTLADVMGKGVASAIIAATVRAVLRSGVSTGDIATAVQAAALMLENDLVAAGAFVTLFHARLDMDSGMLRYIDAGHGLSIIIHPDGSFDRLGPLNLPLGVEPEAELHVEEVELGFGETLVVVSDGILDLFDGTLASLSRVCEIVRSAESAQAAVDALEALGGEANPDDVTVLVVRHAAAAGNFPRT